ncbi:MAG: glycosyltransferase family 2 protein [Zetaproteobacteria bacterium]|nr:glycosyltransferase family 2 protein [Zetaproteobacteria bacterium]
MLLKNDTQSFKLSVVIPAHNEEGCIESTVMGLHRVLHEEGIEHEILVVNDNSKDRTVEILADLSARVEQVVYVNNTPPNGFGFAVRCGLERFSGDAVAVYMADASDCPHDLVRFYRVMCERNVDCVFGTRFDRASRVVDYPKLKLFINRMANLFIQMVFGLRYNDVTNAFKLYKRETMIGLKPFLSHHFNLTVELPLKAIVRGYSYAILPNSWTNRTTGVSKLKIKEMGSRYLFIVLYCFIERWLSRGDYKQSLPAHGLQATSTPVSVRQG